MMVRPGQHVDPQGQVYHPYLVRWSEFWDVGFHGSMRPRSLLTVFGSRNRRWKTSSTFSPMSSPRSLQSSRDRPRDPRKAPCRPRRRLPCRLCPRRWPRAPARKAGLGVARPSPVRRRRRRSHAMTLARPAPSLRPPAHPLELSLCSLPYDHVTNPHLLCRRLMRHGHRASLCLDLNRSRNRGNTHSNSRIST